MTNQESKNLTRESIRIALIQLMKTHSLEEISVRWAENGMQESPEEMGRIVANLYNFDLLSFD